MSIEKSVQLYLFSRISTCTNLIYFENLLWSRYYWFFPTKATCVYLGLGLPFKNDVNVKMYYMRIHALEQTVIVLMLRRDTIILN